MHAPGYVGHRSSGHAAAGLGVLLLGTDKISVTLAQSSEARQRWARVVRVDLTPAARVSAIYELWFPAFATHISAIGRREWDTFIQKRVARGRPVDLRHLDNHARFYFRRMARKFGGEFTRETVPFNEQIFLLTLAEACWGVEGDGGEKGGHDNAA